MSLLAMSIPAMAIVTQSNTQGTNETAPDGPGCGSYARFSTEHQDERSITDQQRKCQTRAQRDGNQILPHLQFLDEAVSGAKHSRIGFNAMLAAARVGMLKVLYIESLSRLARDCVLTLQTLRELVFVYKIRIVAIDDGIDTAQTPNWEMLAAIFSVQNEQYLKFLADQVFRDHEGLVLDGYCVGDYCLGYGSEPIPGTERKGRDKVPKPLLRYIIVWSEAEWVVRIFNWFVHERRPIRWIVRELNRRNAPKDHRSTTMKWRGAYVIKVLKNKKYIGIWPWGQNKNVRDPMTGQKHQEQRLTSETKKWQRNLPELQIVEEAVFSKAQELLAANAERHGEHRRKNGKLNGSSPRNADHQPRHLLAGLIKCGHCGRRLNVGGPNGKYLFCPGYAIGDCTCQTQLRRDRAESMILHAISQRILANEEWVALLLNRAVHSFSVIQQQLPDEVRSTEEALADAKKRSANLLDNCEKGIVPALQERLKQVETECNALEAKLAKMRIDSEKTAKPPSLEWVVNELANIGSVLREAAPAAAFALRALVGGTIIVREIRQPNRKRFYLQGTLNLKLSDLATAVGIATVESPDSKEPTSEAITLDFREPLRYEILADEMKRLWDEGRTDHEIAAQLNCHKALVKKGLDHWHEVRGLVRPDGRSCKKRLKGRRRADPLIDQIMEKFHQDIPVLKIAADFGCCPEIVREAIASWHVEQGLPIPDGRNRRRQIRLAKQGSFDASQGA